MFYQLFLPYSLDVVLGTSEVGQKLCKIHNAFTDSLEAKFDLPKKMPMTSGTGRGGYMEYCTVFAVGTSMISRGLVARRVSTDFLEHNPSKEVSSFGKSRRE